MKSKLWIFSANDVVINLGVITAGALVARRPVTIIPDLIMGTIAAGSLYLTVPDAFWR